MSQLARGEVDWPGRKSVFLVLVKGRCILILSEWSRVVEWSGGRSESRSGASASGFLLLIINLLGVPSQVCARPTWMRAHPNNEAWVELGFVILGLLEQRAWMRKLVCKAVRKARPTAGDAEYSRIVGVTLTYLEPFEACLLACLLACLRACLLACWLRRLVGRNTQWALQL